MGVFFLQHRNSGKRLGDAVVSPVRTNAAGHSSGGDHITPAVRDSRDDPDNRRRLRLFPEKQPAQLPRVNSTVYGRYATCVKINYLDADDNSQQTVKSVRFNLHIRNKML